MGKVSKKIIIFILIVINIGFVFSLLHEDEKPSKSRDLAYISGKNISFKEASSYLTNLAKTHGAPYAFTILRDATLPPHLDIHLLGHFVGDELFKQQGADGILECTPEFRNACSHSIVVGLFLKKGDTALPQIQEACRKAPGGPGAYMMCYHGLGHGILAYTNYDMKNAVALCKKTGNDTHDQEYKECVGGMLMEMIAGGFHNQAAWQKQRAASLSKENPLAPCNTDLIPDEVKGICYHYLTPHLFEAAGANLASPKPDHFQKSFTFCDEIPESEQENKTMCYAGFGKEFIVLAREREIRNNIMPKDSEFEKMVSWCMLGPSANAIKECLLSSVNSLYWGGENDKKIAIQFCSFVQDQALQNTCFTNLIGAVNSFKSDAHYKTAFCKEIPEPYYETCTKTLNI